MTEEKTGLDEKYLRDISKCIARSAKNYDTVQRLLEFLNLNSTPGVMNLFKIYYFKFLNYPPLKHPPTKPPRIFDKDGFASVKEYLWYKGQDGKPIFIGKISEYLPRLKDFIRYFDSEEYSFSQQTPEQFKKLCNIWDSLVRRFSNLAQANTQKERDDSYSKLGDFVKERLEDYQKGIGMYAREELTSKITKGETLMPYIAPPITLRANSPLARYGGIDISALPKPAKPDTTWEIQEINALVLNFWIKHKELLPLLRQCQCCGSFWIKNDKRRFFCDDVCNDAYNKQSRPSNSRSASASKKKKRTRTKKGDYSEIMDYYIKTGYSKEYAEEHARKWVYDNNKTLKNFKRHEMRQDKR